MRQQTGSFSGGGIITAIVQGTQAVVACCNSQFGVAAVMSPMFSWQV